MCRCLETLGGHPPAATAASLRWLRSRFNDDARAVAAAVRSSPALLHQGPEVLQAHFAALKRILQGEAGNGVRWAADGCGQWAVDYRPGC